VRIIAGEFRGRKILPPQGTLTRPITDRVKQSVFDVLAPGLAGAVVYDLFAGTGSLGLECLSRGCESVTFFESDRSALALLEKNVGSLGVADRARIVAGDLFQWFEKSKPTEVRANLLFLDPPYRFVIERADELCRVVEKSAQNHLRPGGIVVFRHDSRDGLVLPKLSLFDTRSYGSMRVDFLSVPDAGGDRR
jgi:16S rRNA (guanine966-N2)-methyltransferase